MIERIPARAGMLAAAALLAMIALGLCAGAASAETEVVYNNLPAANPGNVVSQAFEATQTGQFGGLVQLGGTNRKGGSVTIAMSSWGCQHGSYPGTPECTTEMGARFPATITLNVHAAGPGDEVGATLRSITRTFNIPYRPSQNDRMCKGGSFGAWYYAKLKACFHGRYTRITFPVGRFTWPSQAIVSVAFNTSDYGAVPQRPQPCNSEVQGCGYDSLNVGLTEPGAATPSVGSDPLPEAAYQDSQTSSNFCDSGVGGTGVFRLDSGCWNEYQPLVEVKAAP
ncbi:MAG TPA: hypothetical protein VHT27_02645 [Solirubrobacteraceae bacterium]|nr:hypothetical protein [Solirubrobacteraceae bacterium]